MGFALNIIIWHINLSLVIDFRNNDSIAQLIINIKKNIIKHYSLDTLIFFKSIFRINY